MTDILHRGDRFSGPLFGSRKYNWHVDTIMDSITEPQIDGTPVHPKDWPDDDPRLGKLEFANKPIDPYVVTATRYKVKGPDQITLYGKAHPCRTTRGADAPRRCVKISPRLSR